MQPVPCLSECGGGFRLAVQQARRPYEMAGHGGIACDGVELLVQHAREGRQIVALVLQGHAHGANACEIFRFTLPKLRDDEVEQILTGRQIGLGQRQGIALSHRVGVRRSSAR
jgi:hypothetical protein